MTLVEDAFASLVDQFKDPFAFVRELVQNALDAGSSTVDVDVRREGELVSIEVQDTGEGMNRDIIENQLVRLFSSSKDGDATKIGKFGIGFASVFSIRPEAVVVDTARGVERLRVVFRADGAWKLYALDEPIEGTRVRVLKRVRDDEDARRIADEARRTLARWCRFVDADIRFAGAPVREPFDVDGPVRVRVPLDAPGDEIVIGLRVDGEASWGFYNKGLTLLEGSGTFEDVPPWVSFRVRDGALEHTITRDNVMRDDAFARVMERVHSLARTELIDAVLAAIEADHADADRLQRALAAPVAQGLLKSAARQARRAFRGASGAHLSIAEVKRAARDACLASVDGSGVLADALTTAGWLVLRAPAGSGAEALLAALAVPAEAAHKRFVAVASATEKEQWDAAPLAHALAKLLPDADVSVSDVLVGRIEDGSAQLSDAPCVIVTKRGGPVERAHATLLPAPARGKAKEAKPPHDGPQLVVNLRCGAVRDALELSRMDLWLAAFLLLRHVRADAPFEVKREADLAARAISLRKAAP